ncbi:MAG: DNA polymerase III subunit delta [Desulfovibrionaceae bacterium]
MTAARPAARSAAPAAHRHFLVCPDAELLARRVADLAAPGAERKVFWADAEPPLPDAFWQHLTIKDLFATPKTLVLRRAQLLRAEHWDKLDAAARTQASTATLCLCLEGAWTKKTPPVPQVVTRRGIFQQAEREGAVWTSPGLTRQGMAAFVREHLAAAGVTAGPEALRAVAEALPLDARQARLELDKLVLAAEVDAATGEGRAAPELTPAHADLIPPHEEMDFFAFLDALASGRAEAVWTRVLADHLRPSKDKMLFPLLSAVAREGRVLGCILAGEAQAARLPGFVMNRKVDLARRLGRRGVARLFDLALEAELGVKSGQRRPEQALEMLAAGLMRLYAGRA